jgi:hypothetical protein
MCLVLLVSFMRQCKQHVLQMTCSGRTKHLFTILPINIHDFWSAISGYLFQIWRYETLSASSRNWQKSAINLDWKVCWRFFFIFYIFFCLSFAFINLLGRFFVAIEPYNIFLLLLNICPLSRLKPDLYVQGCKALFVWFVFNTKEHHIQNSNKKKTLRGPGYRLVNAVKLSLQSGRNTQLRTYIILIIFSCFRNTTVAIISNNNKKHQYLRYNNI